MLSGGNQQKIVIARWLFAGAELFILDEPTQGIDIAAKIAVYRLINGLTAAGKAVILISSDHDELLAMTDRVGIMSHGRMVTVREAASAVQEPIWSGPRRMSRSRMSGSVREIAGPLAACLLVALVVALTTPTFVDLGNLNNLVLQVSIVAIMAVGSTDRHPLGRHRSFARLGDRADDGRPRLRGQALGCAVLARRAAGAAHRPGAGLRSTACSPPICASPPSSRRSPRFPPFAASPSCSTTARRSARSRPGSSRSSTAAWRACRCRSSTSSSSMRCLLVSALHGDSAARSMRSAATPMRPGCRASMSRAVQLFAFVIAGFCAALGAVLMAARTELRLAQLWRRPGACPRSQPP